MARRESQAVAGFFPTPPEALRRAVGLIRAPVRERGSFDRIRVCDPCAGEGVALNALIDHLGKKSTAVLAVEMERTRFAALEKSIKVWDKHVAHGDIAHTVLTSKSVNLLWLNPPYDHDREFIRLEERFLRRTVPLLVDGGTLAYVVPAYALSASATTLATHFDGLTCFRFPPSEYAVYKQVVLFARKVTRPEPDPRIEALVRAWATEPEAITELPEAPTDGQLVVLTDVRPESVSECRVVGMDMSALSTFDPWTSTTGPVANVRPADDLSACFNKTWPVATRPRAAHLAAALAAGVFNGCRVEPDDPFDAFLGTLPPLLVKGVFDREWRTVEEKHNKDGAKVAEVQVQQPSLSVTVLDLSTGTFHALSRSADLHHDPTVGYMSLADLLDRYGLSLMRAMLAACPVGFDAARGDVGPDVDKLLGRPLFAAQREVVHATLRLIDEDASRGVVVLGEIGSGKTSVSLAVTAARGCKRILVVCPPHLLDGWVEQAAAVVPTARSMVLDTISSVEAFFAPGDDTRIGVLSREKAKLGHGWSSVSTRACPRCGAPLALDHDYATKRERCEHEVVRPHGAVARWLVSALPLLARYFPKHALIQRLFPSTPVRKRALARYEANPLPVDDRLRALVLKLASRSLGGDMAKRLVWAVPEAVNDIIDPAVTDATWEQDQAWKALALALVEPVAKWSTSSYSGASWTSWERYHTWLHGAEATQHPSDGWTWNEWQRSPAGPTYQGVVLGSDNAFNRLLDVIYATASFRTAKCGEPLYAAVPEPRRYPLATYIARRHLDNYDALIVDEAHEFSTDGSAQTNAAQRLLLSRKAIRLLLTGSFANGYADSVFLNMYAVSPSFRAHFARTDRVKFVDRYGYWKRVVDERDGEGKVVAFGSHSDRVTRTARKSGMAPGILPVFLLEHLLPVAVTLQKEDLRIDIPPTSEHPCEVEPDPEQASNFAYLLRELLTAIRQSRRDPKRAGKLWGALAILPSYLDRAAVGPYDVSWPESCGGGLIASVPAMDPGTVLPKERWMLDTLAREIAEGRNTMVLGWHTDLLPRLVRLVEEAGYRVATLDPAQVPTGKRQAWIEKEVVKTKVQVLVCNPVTVQTGLNNLVHFATQVWMENPAVNPAVYRQTCGRCDRIGQTLPTRFHFPVYGGTPQEKLRALLFHKVGVSRGVDGLDPEEALRAAGVVDEQFSGFSVGRELYRMLTGE